MKDKDIIRLYERDDCLWSRITLYDYLVIAASSLFISVIASSIYNLMGNDRILSMILCIIVILFFFFILFLFRYFEKRHIFCIDEYERNLLQQKINDLEKELTITADDEKFLKTQRVIIKELIEIRKKEKRKKQKEQLENDIKQAEELNLLMGEYDKYDVRKIYINGKEGYLVYDQEKGKENDCKDGSNLINQEYLKLFQILEKYKLISYENKA